MKLPTKFASFEVDGRTSWGLVDGLDVIDLGAVAHGDLRSAIAANALADAGALANNARWPQAAVTWLPVIPNPGKILCIGLNYKEHVQETGRTVAAYPTVFARFPDSQTGHGCGIPLPRVSSALDYEGELAVIIGKAGRYISREHAMDHVAGYACYNDVSVRDWQNHTHQFTPGKNFPATGAFGPWLATPESVGPLDALRLRTRVNGELVQDAALAEMIFDVAQLIEYCSGFTRLEPGDVIVSGTPGGVGARRNPQRWLAVGDEIEVSIDRVGVLRNRIVAEAPQ